MATPLWLAKIDSPSSGAVSTIVDSSAGTAVNLTCTSVTGTSIASGVGASFGSSSGAVSGSLSGTKIATALAGATRCTLEGEFDTTTDAGFMDMLGLQATSFDDFCSMFTGSAGASRVAIAGCGGGVYFTVTPGRHRFLAVIDSTQATNTNRLILYVDGSPAAVDTGVAPSWPALNATIDAGFTNWANNRLTIGCLISAGVQSFQGPAYIAALYSSALTSTDASGHNTAIAANNDADPNGSTGNTMTVAATSPVSTMAASLASKDSLSVAATSPVATMAASLATVANVITVAATSPVSTMTAALAEAFVIVGAAVSPVASMAAALFSTDVMSVAGVSPVSTMAASLFTSGGVVLPFNPPPLTVRVTQDVLTVSGKGDSLTVAGPRGDILTAAEVTT